MPPTKSFPLRSCLLLAAVILLLPGRDLLALLFLVGVAGIGALLRIEAAIRDVRRF